MTFDPHFETQGGGTGARGAGPGCLPCLNSNNSPENCKKGVLNTLSTSHRKTAFSLASNVGHLVEKRGPERVGALTITFPDELRDAKEASRRFDSFNKNVLAGHFEETITVYERSVRELCHFHMLVATKEDIKTGTDVEKVCQGEYSAANEALRGEWRFFRGLTNYNGRRPDARYGLIGRIELLPIKSTAEAISCYFGKYIGKHIGQRLFQDKGVRLVRYQRGASFCSTRFMFQSPGATLWRHQAELFALANGCSCPEEVAARFGPQWAYTQREAILAMEPKKPELWPVWESGRIRRAEGVALALGITTSQAYASLFQRGIFEEARASISFDVPRIAWAPTVREIEGCESEGVDVSTIWNET